MDSLVAGECVLFCPENGSSGSVDADAMVLQPSSCCLLIDNYCTFCMMCPCRDGNLISSGDYSTILGGSLNTVSTASSSYIGGGGQFGDACVHFSQVSCRFQQSLIVEHAYASPVLLRLVSVCSKQSGDWNLDRHCGWQWRQSAQQLRYHCRWIPQQSFGAIRNCAW